MSSINDWASKAAHRIATEITFGVPHVPRQRHENRIAAIIATFAEPLVALLKESRREHHHCDDSWYCCGKCKSEDHCGITLTSHDAPKRRAGVCDCGADAWNARVDAALAGEKLTKMKGGGPSGQEH